MHLKRAIEIAREAIEGGADWIEAGTPLIKSEGAECLRTLKKEFPGRTLVADMKTMDVGAFEVEIAAKAGANIVTVLGLSDDGTISESVLTARKYGAAIMLDLINVPDKVACAKRAEELGVSYVCLHVGIDEQMKGEGSPLDIIAELSKAVSIPVAVAGGITSETAPKVIEHGASIVIVGGGIIKTKDVRSAAKAVKDAMKSGKGLPNALARKYGQDELFQAFGKVSTCNIADAAHKRGVMDNGIVLRNGHGVKVVGRAVTVQTTKGDWAKPVEAIDHAKKGDVIVIDAGGSEIAIWGELAANSALVKGVAGVVIDGAARDIDGIIDLKFPCFSRHVSPHAGEPKGFGGIGLEIVCGGQMVRTGDWIVGDESGAIVIPQEHAVEVANRAVDVFEREERIRAEIQRGRTLSSVQELEKWEQIK